MFKRFMYQKDGGIKEYTVYSLSEDASYLKGISFEHMSEEERNEFLEAAEKFNAVIKKMTPKHFRQYITARFVSGTVYSGTNLDEMKEAEL